ncbi:DUF1307 domain-containing protein [Enterococcus rotai]|uniref:DUF1307 domain-containing protein n=1 Tax=Enterococcus rotai TaxID=118060 RepID=UPI0032B61B7F
MKKYCKVVGLSLLCLLFVSACGAKKQTTMYQLKQDDEYVTVQNVAKEDTLLAQTITTTIQYETMGVKTKSKAEKLLNSSKELYSNKQGVNYSIVFNEKEATETIELDLKEISHEDVKTLPLISLPDGDLNSASEKVNGEKLINLGFKKKTK